MSEKRIVLLLSISLFLMMFSLSVHAEPVWYGAGSEVPANYSPTTFSEFNITWTNDVNMTFITITNATDGTVLINNASMTNSSYLMNLYYNYSIILPAGSWNWISYANNTTNEWNSTGNMTVEIGKGTVPLVLENNNSWSVVYLNPTNTNGSSCPAQLNCTLYRNDTNVTNPDVNSTFPIGSYVYVYNTSGNENYSSNSTTNTLIVNKIPTSISLWIDGLEASKCFIPNQIANFTAMINVSNLTINLSSNYTGWNNTSNDTLFYNTTNLTEQGVFYITASSEGNDTYASTSTTYYFDTIPPVISFITSNTSEYDFNKTYWLNITVFSANISNVTLEFNNTTQTVSNSSNTFFWSIRDLSAGNYTYRWNITNSLGNKTTTDNITFNVTKKASYAYMLANPGWTTLSGVTTTITCNKTVGSPDSTMQLYRDGSLKASATAGVNSTYETATLSEGSYTYICYVTESLNSNYSNYSTSGTLTIQASGSFTPGGGTGDDTTTTTGQFTLSTSDSSVSVEAGSSRVVSFTLANTLSSGDVRDVTVTVTGISSDWYALDKTTVDRVRMSDEEKVRMTLNIPVNATADTYTITFKVAGTTFSGGTISRQVTVSLIVSNPNEAETAAIVLTNDTGNDTMTDIENQTGLWSLGLLSLDSEYFPYIVLALAACVSVIIFLKREALTQSFMRAGGVRPADLRAKHAEAKKKHKTKLNLPSMDYKLSINLVKGKKEVKPDIEEEKIDDLEREIKKDMKELQNIFEAEKKIRKKRK